MLLAFTTPQVDYHAFAPELVLTGALVLLLVVDVVLGGWLPFLLAGLTTAWFVLVWYVVPLTTRERNE